MAWLGLTSARRAPRSISSAVSGRELASQLVETAKLYSQPLRHTAIENSFSELLADSLEQLRHDLSRKPRVVMMGEFNAGKTTLANVLAHGEPLMPDVLSNTRLPSAVHHVSEPPEPIFVAHRRSFLTPSRTAFFQPLVPFEHTSAAAQSDLLRHCCLIDLPGMSDPSYPDEGNSRQVPVADVVIWCTVAAQGWKASEAAYWSTVPRHLHRRSLLVITGADSLSARDRERVRKRVMNEAGALFAGVVMIASRDAQRATDLATGAIRDRELWVESGAEELERSVLALVRHVNADRQRRSRRWAARLMRQLDIVPIDDIARCWWLPALMTWSDTTRSIVRNVRSQRIDRAAALAGSALASDVLRDELAGNLRRLRREDVLDTIDDLIARNLQELEHRAGRNSTSQLADRLQAASASVFNGVARVLQRTRKEAESLANLRQSLLSILGETNTR